MEDVLHLLRVCERVFVCLQLQPNSYYTFYDDHMQNWSVIFESEKSGSDFCKEVSEDQGGLLRPDSKPPPDLGPLCCHLLAFRCVWLKPTAPPPWTLPWSRT